MSADRAKAPLPSLAVHRYYGNEAQCHECGGAIPADSYGWEIVEQGTLRQMSLVCGIDCVDAVITTLREKGKCS